MPPAVVDRTASSPPRDTDLESKLNDAVGVATLPRLRFVLRELFKIPSIAKEASELLLAPKALCQPLTYSDAGSSVDSSVDDGEEEEEEEDTEESSEEPPNGAAPVAGTKRLRARYVTCEQCDEEFDATANYKGDCVWHDGNLDEIVDDFWCDHDEDCHGKIDTDDMREEYPDGFIWSCCDELGSAPGCHSTAHKARQDSVKRQRY